MAFPSSDPRRIAGGSQRGLLLHIQRHLVAQIKRTRLCSIDRLTTLRTDLRQLTHCPGLWLDG
jgi:hypothetical protein